MGCRGEGNLYRSPKRNLIKKPWVFMRVPYTNILGLWGQGFLIRFPRFLDPLTSYTLIDLKCPLSGARRTLSKGPWAVLDRPEDEIEDAPALRQLLAHTAAAWDLTQKQGRNLLICWFLVGFMASGIF